MTTGLDDASAVHHHDEVGLADRRESVCDDDRRPTGERGIEGALHRHLGLGVEVRRRLVEDDDVGRLEQQPGDRQALLLAATQPVAAVSDNGVEALGQVVDEVTDLCRPKAAAISSSVASGRA